MANHALAIHHEYYYNSCDVLSQCKTSIKVMITTTITITTKTITTVITATANIPITIIHERGNPPGVSLRCLIAGWSAPLQSEVEYLWEGHS
eukprot:10096702-Prorocentrum_lima.AAC.1